MIESVYARTLARVRTCIYIYIYIDQNTFLIWEGVLTDIGWPPLACIGWMNFRVSFSKLKSAGLLHFDLVECVWEREKCVYLLAVCIYLFIHAYIHTHTYACMYACMHICIAATTHKNCKSICRNFLYLATLPQCWNPLMWSVTLPVPVFFCHTCSVTCALSGFRVV